MRWIGIDAHKHFAQVFELLEDGEKKEYRIALPRELDRLTQRLQPDDAVVLEASTNSFCLYDELVPHVDRVVVAHPNQTRGATAHSAMTDRKASEVLARLLHSGFIREVWVPSAEFRGLRSLVKHRFRLVQARTAAVVRIRSLLQQELLECPTKTLLSRESRTFLESASQDPRWQLVVDSLVRQHDFVQAEIDGYDAALARWCQGSEDARLLLSVPGLGPINTATILSQITTVERFPTPKNLCSYAGLVPRVKMSGKFYWTGSISRAGRGLFRWSLGLAVQHACRRPGSLQNFRDKLLERRPRRVANVACCRKLLTIIWHMLKNRTVYRDQNPELTRRKLKALDCVAEQDVEATMEPRSGPFHPSSPRDG